MFRNFTQRKEIRYGRNISDLQEVNVRNDRIPRITIIVPEMIKDNALDIKNHIEEIGKIMVEIRHTFPPRHSDEALYIFLVIYPRVDIEYYPKHYVLWQTEQISSPDVNNSYYTKNIEVFKKALDVYEISLRHYERVDIYNQQVERRNVFYNPLPFYHENSPVSLRKKTLDCLFFGTFNQRRNRILGVLKERLRAENISFEYYFDLFGEKRDKMLENTKYIVNIHFYQNPSFEGSRVNIGLRYNCLCISEDVEDDSDTKELYADVTKFTPVINDDCSNIEEMVNMIKYNLQSDVYNNNISDIEIKKYGLHEQSRKRLIESLAVTCEKANFKFETKTYVRGILESAKLKKKELESMCKTGVVITTHGDNGIFVKQCLECYIRELPRNYFIVLFINESNDQVTLDLMEEYNVNSNENIEVIYIDDQTKNGGLTATWNRGIDMCLDNRCDIVILSNDDILFDSCINHLISACWEQRDEMKYFGPTSNNPGPYVSNKCQYAMCPKNVDDCKAIYKNKFCNLNGFMFVISREVLLKNKFDNKNYFDSKYPFDGNEVEWFERFKNLNGIPMIVPKTFIYHYKLATWRKNVPVNDTCIYTVNTGNYEGNEIHIASNNEQSKTFDILYYTDNLGLIYNCVTKGVMPMFIDTKNKETKLIQRTIKTNPSEYLPLNYKKSVYIDGNVFISNFNVLSEYVRQLNNYDIICFKHPVRTKVYDEAYVVQKEKLERRENVNALLDIMKKERFGDKMGLTETNVLLRNHVNLKSFSKDWKDYINICRRDQIIFNFLLEKHKVNFLHDSFNDKMSFVSKVPHTNPKKRKVG